MPVRFRGGDMKFCCLIAAAIIGASVSAIPAAAVTTTLGVGGTWIGSDYFEDPHTGRSRGVEQYRDQAGFYYQTSSSYGGDTITLHDDAFGATAARVYRQGRGLFSLDQADIYGYSRTYRTAPEPFGGDPDSDDAWDLLYYDNLGLRFRIDGYLAGDRVSSLVLPRYEEYQPAQTVSFGDRFADIDMAVFTLLFYDEGLPWGLPDEFWPSPNTVWCDEWCGEVGLNNVQLSYVAPVPLPAALPLFGSALIGIALLSWRRRRRF
ncbi:MAG: VPLPA-CTERM sorting domain-containing protein [Paracoccaceae bacterium]